MANKKGGGNRDWGYASYDVDRYDDYSDSNLQYTSYEKSGSVNRYGDNGDGGHTHERWENSSDYNNGSEADFSRSSSNSSPNPSIGEVENNGGCYLTSACMKHFQNSFDDNCYELTLLRWFRDNFVSKEDVEHYYEVAPIIVEAINKKEKSDIIYDYIYDNVVDYCVKQIEQGNYDAAYSRYKNSVLALEKQFVQPTVTNKFVKNLKLKSNN